MARRISLITRLGISISLVFALGGGAVAVAALAYGRSAAQQSYDQLLIGAARQIAQSITLKQGRLAADLPVSAFELLSLAPEDRIVYAVYDAEGDFVTGYRSLEPPTEDAAFYNSDFGDETVRVAQVRRLFAERNYVGTATVLVGHTLRARRQLAAQITRNALIAVGSIGVVMTLLAAIAVRSAVSPLRKIERHMAGRSAKDLTPIDPSVPIEVEGLVSAVNRFMERLQRQIEVMRNFIADASHQLRTPVAALRAQADLAAEETDATELQMIAGRIYKRSVNLSRLTEQLLTHALIIHRADAVELDTIDLRLVAIRVLEETDHELFDQDVKPKLDLPEDPVPCRGDMLSLVEACKNLLGNALRYGRPPVSLTVGTQLSRPFIAVRDHGPGIPDDHWSSVEHRYIQTSGVSPESAGLGLAIVSAVANAHGGTLRFARPDAGGFEAVIGLPPMDTGVP